MLCRPLDRMATDVRPLGWLPRLSALGVFDALDHPASKVLLPPGGVALAVFGGWVVPPRLLREQLGWVERTDARALVILPRYVAPLGIIAASVLSILSREMCGIMVSRGGIEPPTP